MNCPDCKEESVMSTIERHETEIDFCKKCQGVWLDQGKLEKIIEKSLNKNSVPYSLPRKKIQKVIYRDLAPAKKTHLKNKRKKSFFQSLFN
jgi:Zn-finger nucleic acid-binding protein